MADERTLARECVGMLGRRWSHVRAVGRAAETLAARTDLVSDAVVGAAWLHDVGYGPTVQSSGFHALDGARYLAKADLDPAVVNLVAFHTGATYEADERGLTSELAEFAAPDPDDLDVLTMIDLSVSPDGFPIVDSERLAEVLMRYTADDPVARAVLRSRPSLLAASRRAKQRLGLSDDWPICT
ncbi:MAG TPA: HD domain-containing protein [Marmoricola sp.]|nr:HD domain-containing protein [Marmoricola sp.]